MALNQMKKRGVKQTVDMQLARKLASRKESGLRVQAQLDPQSYAERYWARVDRSGGPEACWPWTGPLNWAGYGTFYTGGWPYQEHAHRTALRLSGTEPPSGGPRHGVVDHLCKNRACCNPAHLRVTTQRINSTENSDSPLARNARKKECLSGHAYTPENTFYYCWKLKAVGRVCLTCYRASRPGSKRQPNTREDAIRRLLARRESA